MTSDTNNTGTASSYEQSRKTTVTHKIEEFQILRAPWLPGRLWIVDPAVNAAVQHVRVVSGLYLLSGFLNQHFGSGSSTTHTRQGRRCLLPVQYLLAGPSSSFQSWHGNTATRENSVRKMVDFAASTNLAGKKCIQLILLISLSLFATFAQEQRAIFIYTSNHSMSKWFQMWTWSDLQVRVVLTALALAEARLQYYRNMANETRGRGRILFLIS
jgi:hypothetical protein